MANVVSLPIQIRGDCLFNNRYKRGPLKFALGPPYVKFKFMHRDGGRGAHEPVIFFSPRGLYSGVQIG